ncbi:putative helicase MOV-10 [Branchiostoma floridae]|uniref:RNA helicase n=1 Tax=Branchiostoma floridae TaxID=7739 RepID=A0A9J7L7F9_BRAFL|nr:putative helicase MOV-10 [Branchiostoma floridae]
MVQFTISERQRIGLTFLQFLEEHNLKEADLTKTRIKEIYNTQFRQAQNFQQIPNCSSVLFTLSRLRKIHIETDIVRFGPRRSPFQRKSRLAVDQYIGLSQARKNEAKKVPGDQNKQEQPPPVFTSRRQRVQHLLKGLKTRRHELAENKEEVEVFTDHDAEGGAMHISLQSGEELRFNINIRNTSDTESVQFCRCELLRGVRAFQLSDQENISQGFGQKTVTLQPGQQYTVEVKCLARFLGQYRAPIALEFRRLASATPFHIVRNLSARVSNQMVDELRPKVPYKHPPRVTFNRKKFRVVDGVPLPPESQGQLERVIELESYTVPPTLRRLINRGLVEKEDMPEADKTDLHITRALLENSMTIDTLSPRFSCLLHMEEVQMEVDIRRYDMQGAVMSRKGNMLLLKVPGLAENRPSVLRGDFLFARERGPDGVDNVEFKGYVHHIERDCVSLGFNYRLLDKFIDGMKFDVRFSFNRLPQRLQHRAVQLAEEHSLGDVLFPTLQIAGSKGILHSPTEQLKLYDRSIEENAEQYLAVRHIVAGSSRPAPYLLFGPPGTGKTVTLVEAIKQVLKCLPSSTVLACAPSNSAADLLTQRLLNHIPAAQLIRLNALSRSWDNVPSSIKNVCNYDRMTGKYSFPAKQELQKYKVLVTTLVTAGRLASANFPPGHFTHVFIDEAGHAVEPECLIALAGLLDFHTPDGGQLVLAGDPKQLGPVLRSPFAVQFGLDVSLLERYMTTCDLYQRMPTTPGSQAVPYDPRFVTKLLRNYRNHPAILQLPSLEFYDGELIPCADKLARESLCNLEMLPKKGFPIIFHGVVGEDLREERSPSFFNPEEVVTVLRHTRDLLEAKGLGIKITEKEIGIISPYRKQVNKIQRMMKAHHLSNIKVGSVEEFQGEERRIIIISTVRSNPDFLPMDIDFKLGFLRNPKRFNVAITRSKALLIIVGNPHVLSRDKHWNSFLEYCIGNGAYVGCDFQTAEDEAEEITQRLAAVGLDDEEPEKDNDGEKKEEDEEEDSDGDWEKIEMSAAEQLLQPSWGADH